MTGIFTMFNGSMELVWLVFTLFNGSMELVWQLWLCDGCIQLLSLTAVRNLCEGFGRMTGVSGLSV